MIALTDNQLAIVMTAADTLPLEKQQTFIDRVAGRLRHQLGQMTHGVITDDDVSTADVALKGLQPQPAAVNLSRCTNPRPLGSQLPTTPNSQPA